MIQDSTVKKSKMENSDLIKIRNIRRMNIKDDLNNKTVNINLKKNTVSEKKSTVIRYVV